MSAHHAKTADALEARAKELVGTAWADLSELAKVEIREAIDDLAVLQLHSLRADEIERQVIQMEVRHARARMLNWEFVAADKVREAIKQALTEAAELVGAVAKGLL